MNPGHDKAHSQVKKPSYKGLLIILDGLGDRRCPSLNGLTPLEAANTPTLDQLAEEGISGLVDPLYPGVPVGTHTGTSLLMGLAPRDAMNLGRGPVEAAGIGLAGKVGDVFLRCNFATLAEVKGQLHIQDRRAGRIDQGTEALAAALRDVPLGEGITGSLHSTTQHRGVLMLSGPGLSASVTDTDPGSGRAAEGVLLAKPLDPEDPAAHRTAAAVNLFVHEAHRRLSAHPLNADRKALGLPPANGVLTRSAGAMGTHRNLLAKLGLRASVITAERTVEGLGRLFGFRVVTEPGFNALPDTDVVGKTAAALNGLETSDLVFLHFKGPDICSHDRDPLCKRDYLERIDDSLSCLLHKQELVIGVTGDHSTDSNLGRHIGEPVPSLLISPNGRRDAVRGFGESGCIAGGLGRLTATGFLLSLLDAMAASGNYRPDMKDLLFP